MDRDNSSQEGSLEIPEFGFWSAYTSLKESMGLMNRKRRIADCRYDPHQICEDIKEEILEHEEEPNLSPLQNKVRKLIVGVDLCRDVCFLQRLFSSLGVNEAACEVLEEQKYSQIASKIMKRNQIIMRREKYFQLKAQKTMIESLGDEIQTTEEEVAREKVRGIEEGNPLPVESLGDEIQTMEEEVARENVGGIEEGNPFPQGEGAPQEDDDVRLPQLDTHITNEEPANTMDTSVPETGRLAQTQLGIDSINIPLDDASVIDRGGEIEPPSTSLLAAPPLDDTALNLSLGRVAYEASRTDDELVAALQDLPEGGIPEVPEHEITEGVTEGMNGDLEELPSLTELPEKRTRRKRRPVFDNPNYIPNYSKRSERLNRTAAPGRVQVYKGPPSILELFTVDHAMTAPSVNNGLRPRVVSSVIERLYARNLRTETRPHVDVPPLEGPQRRSTAEEPPVVVDASLPRQSEALPVELTDVSLARIPDPEERRPQIVQESSSLEAIAERLRGISVSRLFQKEVTPPRIGPSAPWLSPRSPRIRNLQGTEVEEPIAEPWFTSICPRAPSEQWREFNFVRECFEEMWRKAEEEGSPKRVTLKEVLESRQDASRENWLTLLRVVDKMSLRREVVVAHEGGSVVVMPFEVPYVTELQYSLKDQPPRL